MRPDYPIGTVLRCIVEFADSASAPYDPDEVRFLFETPSDHAETLIFGVSASIVKEGVGDYYVDLPLDEAGPWTWRFEGRTAGSVLQAAVEEGVGVGESDFYDTMATETYATPFNAAVYCKEVLRGGRTFTRSTEITEDEVRRFHSQAYAVINAKLAAQGYETPIPPSSPIFPALTSLEALWVASHVHDSLLSAHVKPTEVTKSQRLMHRFDADMDYLLAGDLTKMAGVARQLTEGQLYLGGISRADKRARQADADRVKPRFERGMFSHAKRPEVRGRKGTRE